MKVSLCNVPTSGKTMMCVVCVCVCVHSCVSSHGVDAVTWLSVIVTSHLSHWLSNTAWSCHTPGYPLSQGPTVTLRCVGRLTITSSSPRLMSNWTIVACIAEVTIYLFSAYILHQYRSRFFFYPDGEAKRFNRNTKLFTTHQLDFLIWHFRKMSKDGVQIKHINVLKCNE